MIKNLIITIILLFISHSLFWNCANIQSPSGGPKDTISPVIINTSPPDRSLNFNDDKVKIRFSKYMNNTSVTDNIFIQPEVKCKYDWWGKNLTIEFLEDLKENTTYSIQFGTAYKDWKGNKPLYDYSLVFSTGEVIDSGRISGVVYGDDLQGAFVYAFKNDDSDSLIFKKADYRAQLSDNGVFFFNALKDEEYRLIAIKDKFDNKVYDPGIDDFGAAQKDIHPSDSGNIEFRLGPVIDTKGPEMTSLISINKRVLEVTFNESIYNDKETYRFEILDSLGRKPKPTLSYTLESNPKKILVLLSDELKGGLKHILKVSSIQDSSGNIISDSLSERIFVLSDRLDHDPPEFLSINIKDSSNIKYAQDVIIKFDSFMELEQNAITLSKSDTLLDVGLTNDPMSISFKADLTPEQEYDLKIDLSKIKKFNGQNGKDSILNYHFRLNKETIYSKLSGEFIDSSNCTSGKIMLLKNSKDSIVKSVSFNSTSAWSFDKVEPGDYYIEVYCDSNGDQEYSFGNDEPFEHSEYFFITNKAIKVKERWDLEDIKVVFK